MRPDREGRRLAGFLRQVLAHGHATLVGLLDELLVIDQVLRIAPAAEEAQADERPGGAVGFLALMPFQMPAAGVLRGPDGGGAGAGDGVTRSHRSHSGPG